MSLVLDKLGEEIEKFVWRRGREAELKIFENPLDAFKQVVIFRDVCDLEHGTVIAKTTYGETFITKDNNLCILLVCYGRASVVPSLWVCAPRGTIWEEFVKNLKQNPEDWAIIEEWRNRLKISIPREVIEKIREALFRY